MKYFRMTRGFDTTGAEIDQMEPCEGHEAGTLFKLNETLNAMVTMNLVESQTKTDYYFDSNGALWQRATVSNLFTDGDMEAADMSVWTVNAGGGTGTAVKSSAQKYRGSQSALLTGGDAGIIVTQTKGAANDYTLKAYVYVDGEASPDTDFVFIANNAEEAATYESIHEGWWRAEAKGIAWSEGTWGFKVVAGATVYVDDASMNIADTEVDITPPATPTGLTLSATWTGCEINITPNTEDDLGGYEFHVSRTSGFTPDATTLVWSGLATRYRYRGLVGATYYVRVRAYDIAGNYSDYCAEQSVTAQAPMPDYSFLDHFVFAPYDVVHCNEAKAGSGDVVWNEAYDHAILLWAKKVSVAGAAEIFARTAVSRSAGVSQHTIATNALLTQPPAATCDFQIGLEEILASSPRYAVWLQSDPDDLTKGRFRTTDGTDSELTSIDGMGFGAFHTYRIVLTATAAKLYIDDVLKATHTLYLPGGTNRLSCFLYVYNNNNSTAYEMTADYLLFQVE